MGEGQSKFHKTKSGQDLSKPWREIEWRENTKVLQQLKNYRPHADGQKLRILLYGPTGAGKSSFINSVNNIFQGRMCTHALVNTGCTTFTKQFTTYKIQKGAPDTFYPFVFTDIMGLETGTTGIRVEDIKNILVGHVKECYTFNPLSEMSNTDPYFNEAPTDDDRVHVLVSVISAKTVSLLPKDIVLKIQEIREAASKLGIPQVVILTNIDTVCPELSEDLKNIYLIHSVKKRMEEFSEYVGFPMNCIFPVKNYHEEINLNNDMDSLILNALQHIINFGDDYINFLKRFDN